MTTDPITRLNAALEGRYEVEREIGEGGMATVFLAKDLKHNRNVALKVLKPELAAVVGAERFLAEIETTANLQHPHILPLFDSGEADSFLFYVMPYVEGETLRDKLDREHQLPVDDAVRIATNVAEALDYAHGQGVIHRDIKPANILLQAGKPVISDFGIALAVGAAGGGRLTETGLSLGTPHYMSPEQATGDQTVGPPTDIYALGAVLYEMLVGEPPFTGSTAQAVLGAIITGEIPSAKAKRSTVPANVDAAILRSLEKVPADRFTGAQDFAKALADAGFRHGPTALTVGGADIRSWRRASVGLGSVSLALAGALGWTLFRAPPPGPVQRFTLPYVGTAPPALSPDGDALVIRVDGEGDQSQLWLRRLADLELIPISGTEGRAGLRQGAAAFSPDGQEVAFVVDERLRVARLEGGGVRTVADPARCCPRWEADGQLYFTGPDGNIQQVSPTGGSVESVPQFDASLPLPRASVSGLGHFDFNLSPTGDIGVFAEWRGTPSIWALDIGTGERTLVTPGMSPYLTSSGHLVFASMAGQILAAPFDTDTRQLTAAPITLVEDVLVSANPAVHIAMYTLSTSGTLVYQRGGGSLMSQLVWVTRSGEEVTPLDPTWSAELVPGGNYGWRLSPEGDRLAISLRTDENDDIHIKEMPDGPLRRLTFDQGRDYMPRWKDGVTVTFSSDRGGHRTLWSRRADMVGGPEPVMDLESRIVMGLWSADWLVLRLSAGRGRGVDIVALRPGVDTEPLPVAVSPEYAEQGPAVSPDGRWLAYESNETGRSEVFVRPFPEWEEGSWQVSTTGGIRPVWAHRTGELFFVNPETREMMAAEIQTEPSFRADTKTLFTIPVGYRMAANSDFYDVDSTDERFLMARPFPDGNTGSGGPVTVVVQGWFEELKRQVPN